MATIKTRPTSGLDTFRQHHAMPTEQILSPLYRQLITEWVELHRGTSTDRIVARWARRYPVLEGLPDPGAIVEHVDESGWETADAVMLALLELTRTGQQLAGRVLLQMMLPALESITRRTHRTSQEAAWIEDQRHIVVAEFWGIVAEYPTPRRRRKIAANLYFETLRAVTQPRTQRVAHVPTDDLEETAPSVNDGFVDRIVDPVSSDSSLEEVIAWARARDILTAEEAGLVARVCRPRRLNGSLRGVAAELGCSEAALRQRSSRAKRKLVQGVRTRLLGLDIAQAKSA